MRFVLRTVLALAAALVAAVVLFAVLTLPPASRTLVGSPPANVVFGAYHIHTDLSDGSGTVDDVAAAAAAAGLQFVIITDHGDATRAPDRPEYRHGVLCINAVEIGSDDGHVVALGVRGSSAYPLGGRAIDVVEDIHRLGGWAVVAHPDSPKPELQWRAAAAPYDGVEWLNADSEWRDEPTTRLLATAARSLLRGPEAIASLFDRPARSFRRWDTAASLRPVVGLAAVDAHARLLGVDEDAGRGASGSTWLALPTYGQMFRTVVQAVRLDAPLTGTATDDAPRVLQALRAGRTFSVVRAIAWPASLEFTAEAGGSTAVSGGSLPAAGAVTFSALVPEAPDAALALFRNGVSIATGQGSLSHTDRSDGGVYRIEVTSAGAAVPWIVSNQIHVGAPREVAVPPAPIASTSIVAIGPDADWVIEKESRSTGQVSRDAGEMRLDFGLAPGIPAGQYVALATGVTGDTGFDRIQFVARASAPMRLSVQARLPPGNDGQRWRRSVYIDETPRTIVIPLEDLQPVTPETTQRPVVSHVRGVLFVVDTVNTTPGSSGTVWLRDVALGVGNVGGGG